MYRILQRNVDKGTGADFCIPQGNKKYATYELAKQTARKWIRKKYPEWKSFYPSWLFNPTNPALSDFGYFIKKV